MVTILHCKCEKRCQIWYCSQWFVGKTLGLRKHFLMLGSSTPVLNQSSLQATNKKHEQLKRIHYDQRVREIEHGTFTPLVLYLPPEAWGKQQLPLTKTCFLSLRQMGCELQSQYRLAEMSSEFCSINCGPQLCASEVLALQWTDRFLTVPWKYSSTCSIYKMVNRGSQFVHRFYFLTNLLFD